MRDYIFIDKYLDELQQDVYEQPNDPEHTRMAGEIIAKWLPGLDDVETVVDMGCGTGFCSYNVRYYNKDYVGIGLNIEPNDAIPLVNMDYNFTGMPDNFCDLILSRHSLEHSPFPLLTLMEWHRISSKYLLLVVPNPGYYTYLGRNHYSVLNIRQIRWLLRRAGWKIVERDYSEKTELRFLCTKEPRVGYEGYVATLDEKTYSEDRDGK